MAFTSATVPVPEVVPTVPKDIDMVSGTFEEVEVDSMWEVDTELSTDPKEECARRVGARAVTEPVTPTVGLPFDTSYPDYTPAASRLDSSDSEFDPPVQVMRTVLSTSSWSVFPRV